MFIVPIGNITSITSPGQVASSEKSGLSENPFANVLKDTFASYEKQQEIANQDAYNLSFGESDDLHNVMINSELAATALELTVQLTSKALNAYNEIMRMQI